jgi:hypothetical protein
MLTVSALCQTGHTGLRVADHRTQTGFRRRGAIRQSPRVVGYADRGHATSHAAADRGTTGTRRRDDDRTSAGFGQGPISCGVLRRCASPADDDDEVVRSATGPARIEVQRANARSIMRQAGSSCHVRRRDTFKMAEKLQSDDTVPPVRHVQIRHSRP